MAIRPGRLGIGIIGAGKVGAVLGAALRACGHAVVGVAAVSEASKERAELLLPGVPVLEVADIVERAELVLLAVPDDVLPELVTGLGAMGAWQVGQLVAHTSGRFGTAVLAPVKAAGGIPLALHPAMTFTGMSLDLARLNDCCFGVSAEPAMEMGAEPVVIAEADRVLYHAALAHSANHLVTLVAQAAQILGDIGVESPNQVMGPLLRAALENALTSGESALTGPVARGDVGTVSAHSAALREHALDTDSADVLEAYLAMSAATAARAAQRRLLTAEAYRDVRAALANDDGDAPSATGGA